MEAEQAAEVGMGIAFDPEGERGRIRLPHLGAPPFGSRSWSHRLPLIRMDAEPSSTEVVFFPSPEEKFLADQYCGMERSSKVGIEAAIGD